LFILLALPTLAGPDSSRLLQKTNLSP
jgi:hypothetical protein